METTAYCTTCQTAWKLPTEAAHECGPDVRRSKGITYRIRCKEDAPRSLAIDCTMPDGTWKTIISGRAQSVRRDWHSDFEYVERSAGQARESWERKQRFIESRTNRKA